MFGLALGRSAWRPAQPQCWTFGLASSATVLDARPRKLSRRRPRPRRRARGRTVLSSAVASASGTRTMSVPRSATIVPAVAVVHRVDRVQAEAGGQHPVERGRRAAALDVAEHGRRGPPCRCASRSRSASHSPMPPSRTWPNASVLAGRQHLAAASGTRALGDHDDRRVVRARSGSRRRRTTWSTSNGRSGIRITFAPPARPACSAIQPAWRPMTSTTSARWCDSAVVCSRSIASIAMLHRGVEAEGVVGGVQVVVDRLGHADDARCRRRSAWWRRPACPRRRWRSARRCRARCRVSRIRSTPPSTLNGLVRDEPRMVPPRGRMPRTSATPSGMVRFSSGPASRRGSRRTRGRGPRRPCGRRPGSPRSGPGSRRRR